jgi:hypothetical protein
METWAYAIAGMSQNPSMAVGQVSADGEFRWDGLQWVPIPRGTREPTPWTRPMQLAAAALLAVEAIFSVATTVIFTNHDAVKKALAAQGTQVPQGMTQDTYINFVVASAIVFVVFFALLELVGAVGSYLGWRWIFWAVLVLMAVGGINAIFTLFSIVRPGTSGGPVGVSIVQEVLTLAAAAMFVWMLIGVIRYGPWALKRPGT